MSAKRVQASNGARLCLRIAAASVFAAAGHAGHAAKVEREGVYYDDATQVGANRLVLNGIGVRMVAVFKGYVAGLYLPRKTSEADAVYALPGAKRIAVRMLVDVPSATLAKTFRDGIRKNYDDAGIDALRDRMDTFDAQIRAIGGVKKGDEIDLDFVPSSGTRILLNGKPRDAPIAGDDFYVALLRMFIGERAVDKNLRAALLGRATP